MSITAQPVFVHYGCESGAACCCRLEFDEDEYLVVGTLCGMVYMFNPIDQTSVSAQKVDKQSRQVMAVGQYSADILFVHIRTFALIQMKLMKKEKKIYMEVVRKYDTDHYGFCSAVYYENIFYIPMNANDTNALKRIGENDEYIIDLSSSENEKTGNLMTLCAMGNDLLSCCFEDGSICVVDTNQRRVLSKAKLFPEIILSSAYFNSRLVVSSVQSPLKILYWTGERTEVESEILYPPSSGGCSAVCISPCKRMIGTGYWDGSIRIHSTKTGKIRAYIKFHETTIHSLSWESICGRRLLLCCCKDKTLSIWNPFKDG
ncbi:hypothetical protein AB6A40_009482 [Gnathostoma spinigerum]|uniref:Uncharacterized protein n=1 Tax=Gnathostoma spinigerum TaxID=75299 RepID=A0ABD6ESI6_9BILA